MRDPDRLEPESEPTDEEDFVWPLPPSSADIVWLEPPPSQVAAADGQSQRPAVTALPNDKAAPKAPQQPAALPLSRLLSPEVAYDWHDAVAVIQQLAEQVTHGGREEPTGSLPDIHRIAIEPNGELRVRLDPRGRESLVRGLGNLLHRLLTNRDSPAAVRLIVSQVMSDLPTIQTVEELVRELARWERPYRIQKIVALYERARTAPDISPTPEMAEIDRLTDPSMIIFPTNADLPDAQNAFGSFRDPWAPLRGLKKYRSLFLNVAAVAVCLLLAGSAAIVLLRSPYRAPASPPPAGVETSEAPDLGDAATPAAPPAAAPATPAAKTGVPPAATVRPNVAAPAAARANVPASTVSRSTTPATAVTAAPPVSAPPSRGASVAPAPRRQTGLPETPASSGPAASASPTGRRVAAPPSPVVTTPVTPAPAATSSNTGNTGNEPTPVATDSNRAQAADRTAATNGAPAAATNGAPAAATNRTPVPDTSAGPQPQPPIRFATPPSAPRPSVAVAPPPLPPSTDPGFPDRIYTSADPGVIAPVLIRPYLPGLTEQSQSTVGTRLGVLEVVVDTTGAVESVRLRSPENRYRERWWLFVAKNWQFRPAYKDGQPVRFLTLIPLTDARLTDPQ